MREFFGSIPLWLHLLVVIGLSPLGVAFGAQGGWPPGTVLFVLMTIPVCVAALSGNITTAMVTTLFAASASVAEVFRAEDVSSAAVYVFPLLETAILVAIGGMIVLVVEQFDQRIADLEEQNTRYVRSLYHRDRELERIAADKSCAESSRTTLPEEAGQPGELPEQDTVNFAMLLLTLQDIAQRISTNLDLDALVPTILNTAKSSLKCKDCQLYFWNPREQTLTNAQPARNRERVRYRPRPDHGMAEWVIEHRQILTRKSLEDDYALQGLLEDETVVPVAIAPLTVGGELLGLLVIDDVEEESPTFVRLLYILASNCALGIKNAQLFKRIEEMARHDGLTGLLNHASFQKTLEDLMGEVAATDGPLTVIMSDIDHFKTFNDVYGHQAGDHVLQEVSRLWKAVMPESAVLARYGGEEFICALAFEGLDRARELAETMRTEIGSRELDFEGERLSVTASFGVAEFAAADGSSTGLVRVADEALYQAKAAGRNRVVCYHPDAVTEPVVLSEQNVEKPTEHGCSSTH